MKYFLILIFITIACNVIAQDSLTYTTAEIIYGRKDGMALTMIKVSPKQKLNGKAIISVISGNWVSSNRLLDEKIKGMVEYIQHGYTVFAVMHGSQPRYSIPDQINDLKRAVRFIRYNAQSYGIDSAHIGITGYSSGGHLSLMIATSDDIKDGISKDPIDQVSNRVQAVVAFFPPTDFLNFGQTGSVSVVNKKMLALIGVAGAFDFKTLNKSTKIYESVSDSMAIEIAKQVSPIYNVTSDDPPIFIIHGDADRIVPIQQAQVMIQKLKDMKVTNEFIVIKGKGHGWENMSPEKEKGADWFDKYLK